MVPVGRNDLTRQFRVLRIISASNSISLELDPHLCSGLGEGGWYIESKGSYKETRPCASGEVSWPSLPAWVHAAYIPLSLMHCPQVPCHSAPWENTAADGSARGLYKTTSAYLSSSPMLPCLLLYVKAKQETAPQGKFRALNARTHLGFHATLLCRLGQRQQGTGPQHFFSVILLPGSPSCPQPDSTFKGWAHGLSCP